MATFQVPQFIDAEDKIVGPLTLKQFGFVATAFLLSVFLFYILDFWLWVILAGFFWISALGLAFFRINGRSLLQYLISIFLYFWNPRIFIWKHEIPTPLKSNISEIKEFKIPTPTGPRSKRIAIPEIKLKIPTITITKKPILAKNEITSGTGLKDLSNKMMTTKTAIPKREKPFIWFKREDKEKFETLNKSTGEKIVAKRVDYR